MCFFPTWSLQSQEGKRAINKQMHTYVPINCQSTKKIITMLLCGVWRGKDFRSPSTEGNIKTEPWGRKQSLPGSAGWFWLAGGPGGDGPPCDRIEQALAPSLTHGACWINGGLNLEFILQLIQLRLRINWENCPGLMVHRGVGEGVPTQFF